MLQEKEEMRVVSCSHESCSVGKHTKKNLNRLRKKKLLQYGKKVLRDKQRQCNRGDKDACAEMSEIRKLLKEIRGR